MAAVASVTFDGLRKAIRSKQLAPVYLLHGEEGYFIDALVKEFEQVLTPDEKEFNQHIVYAPDTESSRIVSICHGVPMMADRQMVIVKEAQAVPAAKLDKLAAYLASPVSTTVLVLCFRGAAAKGKEMMAALKKGGAVVFESKRVMDYNIPPYIGAYIKEKGLSADQKALEMLRDYIGNDLAKIFNQVDKLASILPPHAAVTPEVIERNIGVSKDYNTFEFVDALAYKDGDKVFRCINYFRANSKNNPAVMILASVFTFFADLLIAHYVPGKTDDGIRTALNLRNNFFLKRFRAGVTNYNPMQTVEIISAIRRCDVQSKGVGSRRDEYDLLQELAFHILSAPGKL